MADYGYLHLGRILKQDPITGGYEVESVPLARTSKWGPVPSCVPGLRKGDRVILAATGMSRDVLTIIGKVGATMPDVADVTGLLAALHDKASAAEVDVLRDRIGSAEGDLEGLQTAVTALDGRMDAVETRLDVAEAAYGSTWAVDGNFECPGLPLAVTDRMPWNPVKLAGHPTAVTLGPDRKHFIIGKTGWWDIKLAPRWTNVFRVGGGTPGQGTDRTFILGATNRHWGPINPRFETDLTDWTAFGASSATVSPLQAHSGTQSARLVPTGSAADVLLASGLTPVVPGQIVAAHAWFWTTSATTNTTRLMVNWYDASQVFLSPSLVLASTVAGTWTPVAGSFTAPAGAAYMQVVPGLVGTPAAGQIFYVDDVTIGPATTDQAWNMENWNVCNSGNQEYRQEYMAMDMGLSVNDKVQFYCYWNGAANDRLVFPAGSNRISFTYKGHL